MSQSRRYTTEQIDRWIEGLAGSETGPIGEIRSAGRRRFSETGFPTTRHEEWKYTNLRPALAQQFALSERSSAADVSVEQASEIGFSGDAIRLVFVNGHVRSDLSSIQGLPDGVVVSSLADAIDKRIDEVVANVARYPESFATPFVELNNAHLRDGAFVAVADSVDLDRPIHLLFLGSAVGEKESSGTVSYIRNIYSIGRNSRVTIVEEFVGCDDALRMTNVVGESSVGDASRLEVVKIQRESATTIHVGTSHTTVGRDSTYTNNALHFGGGLTRNDPQARLEGTGGHAAIDGLLLADGNRLVDAHTSIDHTVSDCTSHELYKSIVDDAGHAVFNGKIFVQKGAQRTDSEQSNMNLLLSETANVDTKPQLEIFADDVKCTHGATIGHLDETSMFYLRSRGIGKEEARTMLVHAFAAEVIDHIGSESIREYAGLRLDEYFDAHDSRTDASEASTGEIRNG